MAPVEMSVEHTPIPGLTVVTLKQVAEERGVVREFYRQSAWRSAGLPDLGPFLQLNVTETRRGAIRGMHGEAMTKVIGVVAGEAFGAYVDARGGSPAYGSVLTVALRPGVQVVVPPGVCNGFQALEDGTQYLYGFDTEWRPDMAGVAVNPLDEALAIPWPIPPDEGAILSPKDASAPAFSALSD